MLKFLPYAIQALFVLGGVTLGLWLKSSPGPESDDVSPPSMAADSAAHDGGGAAKHDDKSAKGADKPEKKKKEKQAKKKKDGHGAAAADHGSTGADGAGYMKFSRQFVVPVIERESVRSLVVMDLNLEVPESASEEIYAREPKLRDAMLATLFQLSNRGVFRANLLEQSNLDVIRSELLESARSIIGDQAKGVLILNITRQDV